MSFKYGNLINILNEGDVVDNKITAKYIFYRDFNVLDKFNLDAPNDSKDRLEMNKSSFRNKLDAIKYAKEHSYTSIAELNDGNEDDAETIWVFE